MILAYNEGSRSDHPPPSSQTDPTLQRCCHLLFRIDCRETAVSAHSHCVFCTTCTLLLQDWKRLQEPLAFVNMGKTLVRPCKKILIRTVV